VVKCVIANMSRLLRNILCARYYKHDFPFIWAAAGGEVTAGAGIIPGGAGTMAGAGATEAGSTNNGT
jgi:hypothetical protein